MESQNNKETKIKVTKDIVLGNTFICIDKVKHHLVLTNDKFPCNKCSFNLLLDKYNEPICTAGCLSNNLDRFSDMTKNYEHYDTYFKIVE